MICEYGCNGEANHQLLNGKWCCSKRPAGCKVLKAVNSAGLKKAHSEGRGGYIYKDLSDETKARMNWAKGKTITPDSEIFTENSTYSNEMVKHRIVKGDLLEYKCSNPKCGITEWCDESIVLDLDHINGNNTDNRLSNLRYLCPNCHSQTDTYKGRNKNTGKLKVTDTELLAAYKECNNIRQALISVGIAAKGGNYERLKKLISKTLAL